MILSSCGICEASEPVIYGPGWARIMLGPRGTVPVKYTLCEMSYMNSEDHQEINYY